MTPVTTPEGQALVNDTAATLTDMVRESNKNVTNTIETLHDLNEYQKTDSQVLGRLIWWSISEGNVTLDQLKDAAAQSSIPADYMPRAITGGRAFKRAMDKVVKETNKGEKYSGLVVTKVTEDQARLIYTIHERNVNANEESVAFTEPEKVTYLKESNVIKIEAPKYGEQIKEMLGLCQQNYTANDIRMLVTRLVLDFMKSMPVREKGGVYFVPHTKERFLDSVDQFIRLTVGGGIFSFPVFSPDKQKISAIVVETLAAELTQLAEETAEALEETAGATKFKNRLERYEDLRDKVQMYANIMQFNAESMFKIVDEHKAKVSSMMKQKYGNW